MKAIQFPGVTRTVGVSQGYVGLPIKDEMVELPPDQDGGGIVPAMTTKWLPTDEERAIIARGGAIMIRILGNRHPPIMVVAEEPPRPEAHVGTEDFEEYRVRMFRERKGL